MHLCKKRLLHLIPLAITWSDVSAFSIKKVLDFLPAGMMENDLPVDYYTVQIQGKEKLLFFEHIDPHFTPDVWAGGLWRRPSGN